MRKWRRLLRLDAEDRWALIEAWFLSGCGRLAILLLPFRVIAPWLGEHQGAAGEVVPPHVAGLPARVKWAVATASRYTPWNTNCLVAALTARLMIGRRGGAGTIFFGVARTAAGGLRAHAWLRSGNLIVSGQQGMQHYAPVTSFAFGARQGTPE
jgi:hypothetical protein